MLGSESASVQCLLKREGATDWVNEYPSPTDVVQLTEKSNAVIFPVPGYVPHIFRYQSPVLITARISSRLFNQCLDAHVVSRSIVTNIAISRQSLVEFRIPWRYVFPEQRTAGRIPPA